MHPQARSYVAAAVAGRHFDTVVEIGGRNINGGVKDLLDCDHYTSIDPVDGNGVDVVAAAADWSPAEPVDLVLCCEVLEHAEDPAGVVAAAQSYLAPGGLLIITAAGPTRVPHSGMDGAQLQDGEHYANIDPAELADWLDGMDAVSVTEQGADVQATAVAR